MFDNQNENDRQGDRSGRASNGYLTIKQEEFRARRTSV